jgi:hypothetical protein
MHSCDGFRPKIKSRRICQVFDFHLFPTTYSRMEGLLSYVSIVSTSLLAILILLLIRLSICLPSYSKIPKFKQPPSILVILGSGGHTAEMIRLIRNIDIRDYGRRMFVLAKVCFK